MCAAIQRSGAVLAAEGAGQDIKRHFAPLPALQAAWTPMSKLQEEAADLYLFRFDLCEGVCGFINECHSAQHTWVQNLDPKLCRCQKPLSTVFWKCREELLCLKATLCSDTSQNNNGRPVWVNGGRVCRVPVCFRTLSSLFQVGSHLFLWDIFASVSCHHGPNEVEGGGSSSGASRVTSLEIEAPNCREDNTQTKHATLLHLPRFIYTMNKMRSHLVLLVIFSASSAAK